MNIHKFLKRTLCAAVTFSMLLGMTAVPQSAFAYSESESKKIYENNCFVMDTHFYDGDTEIFSVGGTTQNVTASVTVENDTLNPGQVSASVYAADENGTVTKIDGADAAEKTLASVESSEFVSQIPVSSIPPGTIKLITRISVDGKTYDSAEIYTDVKSPVIAPPDSNNTTNGAHDPSIVKFDGDDTYYVYSSHHLIFTTKDLVNWTKYDFTDRSCPDIAPKTCAFVKEQLKDNPNGTYWAPDVIYREGEDKPYWMYISVSCGLGGRNSVVGLIKSPTPLFWADPDENKVNAIEDTGVVFATLETDTNQYKTNAIDANIYTDTDGKQYYVWGSFWGGIQAAELTAEGKVKGVDYSSNSSIMTSCKSVGTSVFTQKNGAAGPEGAWMINKGDYRYMFTSYGWLGSNYNTRVARAPITKKFSENMGTQLVDAKGTIMGSEYTNGDTTKDKITGYKLIGSYRLGDGTMTMTHDEGNNEYYYARSADDAHVYYGPGHNSVINIGDETFYISHTRKDAIEGAAVLQARKLLFTADGWPVVSPVTYAGEIEQPLHREMLLGTYDLASVGVTKMEGSRIHTGTNPNRNYDLPVISSKVVLNDDNSMTNGSEALGTWSFDNDHTVTLTFTKNGDTAKDEFYKNGDVMTMYALYGYDKDEGEPVIALTGTDTNHITQFAKKSMKIETAKTEPQTVSEPAAVTLEKSTGGNPILGFGENDALAYAGDPAATVVDTDGDGEGDTVYLIAGHDTATNEGYNMPEWLVYSSTNMTDWKYERIAMKATDISWRANNYSAWASQMVEYGGKYYLYYCTDERDAGRKSIGVATASSPAGPYTDIGKPLVQGALTTPESSNYNDIDPTVFIDTDENGTEHRYLAWGNGKYYVCELNEDMTSIKDIDGDGQIIMHKDIKDRVIKSLPGGNWFTEAPWIYRRKDADGNYYGKYYLFYAQNWREHMAYATADDLFGRYDFKQILMPPTATSNTNHPSVIDFKGETYFIYHNGALPHGSGFRRSVCVEKLAFDDDGYVYPVTETSIGLDGTPSVIKTHENKFVGHEAFTNSSIDGDYPISAPINIQQSENEYLTAWEFEEPMYTPNGENKANYVSIQSVDKPGLYITSTGSSVTLTQNAGGTESEAKAMTFKTVNALDGSSGISFVSVSDPNKYLTVLGSSLTLSYGTDPENASFTTGNATTKPSPVINPAEVAPEPQPEAPVEENFDSIAANKTLISFKATNDPYTAINGITLYMGTKSSDAQTGQNFKIQTGGVTGNALVLNTGKYQSVSRGGRMQINTPVIPDGYTATASFDVKLGTSSSILRYNDSVSDEMGTQISGLTTSYQKLKITIKNDNETYIRTMTLGDNIIATDFAPSFPVFWGTTENSKGHSIYFDNLSIVTAKEDCLSASDVYVLENGAATATITNTRKETAKAAIISAAYNNNTLTAVKIKNVSVSAGATVTDSTDAVPGTSDRITAYVWDLENLAPLTLPASPSIPTSEFKFEDNLTDTVTGQSGSTVGSFCNSAAASEAAAYTDGHKGGKAVSFSGAGSDGVKLGKIITDSKYTISFWFKANAITPFTSGLFIDAGAPDNLGKSTSWVSAPIGWQSDGTMMVWSCKGTYTDLVSSAKVNTGEWHQATIAADGDTAKFYIDGVMVKSGSIADVITNTTETYLAVNYWDTPFNGLIDDLYVYNGTVLNNAEIKHLYDSTK